MKRLLVVFILSFIIMLSGCVEQDESLEPVRHNHDDYYTQEEVNELLENYVLDGESDGRLSISQNAPTGDWYICTNYVEDDVYISDCVFLEVYHQYTETIDEVVDYVKELEQRITELENENVVVYTNCDIEYALRELFGVLDDLSNNEDYHYTFEVDENGDLIEYYLGEYNETIQMSELLEDYCTLE